MRILDKGKCIIGIQDINKNNGDFINTLNNNINNYTVEILPTDNIF